MSEPNDPVEIARKWVECGFSFAGREVKPLLAELDRLRSRLADAERERDEARGCVPDAFTHVLASERAAHDTIAMLKQSVAELAVVLRKAQLRLIRIESGLGHAIPELDEIAAVLAKHGFGE